MKTFFRKPTGRNNRFGSNIHDTVDQAADAAKPAIDRAASSVHDAVDGAVNAAGAAAQWLDEQSESVHARRRKLLSASRKYVTAHPVKSVGIALVAGVLLAKIAL